MVGQEDPDAHYLKYDCYTFVITQAGLLPRSQETLLRVQGERHARLPGSILRQLGKRRRTVIIFSTGTRPARLFILLARVRSVRPAYQGYSTCGPPPTISQKTKERQRGRYKNMANRRSHLGRR